MWAEGRYSPTSTRCTHTHPHPPPTQALVVGAGPCGLRAAIALLLLGVHILTPPPPTQALVVGAGPCGLRAAIALLLLGVHILTPTPHSGPSGRSGSVWAEGRYSPTSTRCTHTHPHPPPPPTQALVVGAGPCGLRAAIALLLLGVHILTPPPHSGPSGRSGSMWAEGSYSPTSARCTCTRGRNARQILP